ncbi:MAG: arylsulfatase [Planctomycetales bacterium]|nr:arylsulfatase [Planctomycetales bacterium]
MNFCPSRVTSFRAAVQTAVVVAVAAHVAAADRPNILVIMSDDLGYSDISPFGSEMNTPNLAQMASDGVRLTNFYVTPRCSNTRASLLTGQQSHAVGLPNLAGDGTRLPRNNVFVSEVLQASGYHTYMSGKWHLGSTDNFGALPNGHVRDPRVRGFDHYWGFTENHSQDNFNGSYRLLSDEVPERSYTYSSANGQPGAFYQTDAITDYTLDFLQHSRNKNQAEGTDDPFFTYVAFGAPHFPLQARDEWIDPLVSRYTAGWDQLRADRLAGMKAAGVIPQNVDLTDRGWVANTGHGENLHQIREWDLLPADRQADLSRRMAVYAAMVERVDYNIGRILQDLETHGELDNTLILFTSDNGADGEWHEYGFEASEPIATGADLDSLGSTEQPSGDRLFYGTGWANLGATPFRTYKHYTHEGGIKSPVIVQWNNGLDASLQGTINNQVADIRDLMPTLLDLAGVEYPDVWTAVDGGEYETQALLTESLAGFLTTGAQVSGRELGWEHEGNRAFRVGDWKLVSSNAQSEGPTGPTNNEWELYDLSVDPTEVDNLAGDPQHQAQFDFMVAGYERWAWQNKVSSTLPWSAADFNRDGQLDAQDVAAFVTGWKKSQGVGSMETFASGDLDLDGDTDLDDFVLMRAAFALAPGAPSLSGLRLPFAAPEPSCLLLAFIAAAGAAGRSRRD